MQTHDELAKLIRQRTWDKELLLWFGSEVKLLPFLGSIHVEVLDLLDLFVGTSLPVDDDEVRQRLSQSLRQRLRSVPHAPGGQTALIVRSAGLLARYRVGMQEFYDWFCDDFSMAILLIEGRCNEADWPDEVECAQDKLVEYFTDSGMIKRLFGA
jgi:hypothetical protein